LDTNLKKHIKKHNLYKTANTPAEKEKEQDTDITHQNTSLQIKHLQIKSNAHNHKS